jgi:SAM-dependent methyltransferase
VSNRERYPSQENRFSAHFDKENSTMVRNRGLLCYTKALGLGTDPELLIKLLASRVDLITDLGCGEGRFIKEAAGKINHRYFLGIDGASQEQEGSNWKIITALFENLPLSNHSIDMAISVLAFGYYADSPNQVSQQIKEMRRCLKESGQLITVVIPKVSSKPSPLWLNCDDIPTDEIQYDRSSLKTNQIYLKPISCFGLGDESEFSLDLDFFEQEGLQLIDRQRSIDTELTLGTIALTWKPKS